MSVLDYTVRIRKAILLEDGFIVTHPYFTVFRHYRTPESRRRRQINNPDKFGDFWLQCRIF